jgi:hypothetical protein
MPPRHSLAEELGLGLDGKNHVDGNYDDIDLKIQGKFTSYCEHLNLPFLQKWLHSSCPLRILPTTVTLEIQDLRYRTVHGKVLMTNPELVLQLVAGEETTIRSTVAVPEGQAILGLCRAPYQCLVLPYSSPTIRPRQWILADLQTRLAASLVAPGGQWD